MATVRKFTFDLRFDDPNPGRPTLGQALAGDAPGPVEAARPAPAPEPDPEPEPEPEPEDQGPALVYTEEDMEIAREEAYVAGHTAALDDAAAQAERAAAEAMVEAANALRALAQGVGEAHAAYADLAARVATDVCRRLLPETAEDYAVAEITALMRHLLPNLIGQPRLIARTHPDIRDALQRALAHAAEQVGFEGRLTVVADDSLGLSDCRLEWAEGGAERNTTRLWAEIDELIERNIPLFRRGDALEVEEEAPPPPPEPADVWPETVDEAAHYAWVPATPEAESEAETPLDTAAAPVDETPDERPDETMDETMDGAPDTPADDMTEDQPDPAQDAEAEARQPVGTDG